METAGRNFRDYATRKPAPNETRWEFGAGSAGAMSFFRIAPDNESMQQWEHLNGVISPDGREPPALLQKPGTEFTRGNFT